MDTQIDMRLLGQRASVSCEARSRAFGCCLDVAPLSTLRLGHVHIDRYA